MTWQRHGDCNGCGHCCETFSRQIVVRDASTVSDLAFYRARGFADVVVDGVARLALFGWLAARCPQRHESGCAIYDTRPETCRAYPTVPADIVGTPCSYWFTNGVVRVGGDGSPYPTSPQDLLALESA